MKRFLKKFRVACRGRIDKFGNTLFWLALPLLLPRKTTAKKIDDELFSVKNDLEIFLSERDRITIYEGGINLRLNRLASQYHLDTIKFGDNDVVLDCGANIGEIGMYLRPFEGIRYIAFEPSAKEFRACCKNNPNGEVLNYGLWSHDTSKTFYLKTDTADSSLFVMEKYSKTTTINLRSIASVLDELGIHTVKLLKVEAEGAEPEVIRGAIDVLDRIQFISVDCSPERGLAQESTITDVVSLLLENGMEFCGFSPKRYICLFSNKKYQQP